VKPVALKIQRRRYSKAAVYEVSVHHLIRRETGGSGEIVPLHEAFLHDGHVCMAYEKHGRSLDEALVGRPLPTAHVRRITRQLLLALDRLHRCGYAHTDLKPDNILYDPETGEALLADLGSAESEFKQGTTLGTRGYVAPEVIIGAPLSTALDVWSLGCTVFEMLTGRRLFNPRRAAAKKYREFSRDEDAIELPLAESVKADEEAEKAEQFSPGTIIGGKYELESVLGRGSFGTVWIARPLHETPLDGAYNTLWNHAQSIPSPAGFEHDPREREWRRQRGADDLIDLTLNYEHLLQIASLRGPVPPEMVRSARFRAGYFEDDDTLRFRPKIRPCPLSVRLGGVARSTPRTAALVRDFEHAWLADA
jgi:serine/threonine protein kinase